MLPLGWDPRPVGVSATTSHPKAGVSQLTLSVYAERRCPIPPPTRYSGRALATWRCSELWVPSASGLLQPQLRDPGLSPLARPLRGVLQPLVLRAARLQGRFRTAHAAGWAEDREHGRRTAQSWLFARWVSPPPICSRLRRRMVGRFIFFALLSCQLCGQSSVWKGWPSKIGVQCRCHTRF